MSTRSRRQTRTRRFDTPYRNWPTIHNRDARLAKENRRFQARFKTLSAAFATLKARYLARQVAAAMPTPREVEA